MTPSLPKGLLEKFSELLANKMGLHFPSSSLKELEKKIHPIGKAFGFTDLAKCIEWLLHQPLDKEQISILAYYLTVGETYFFRDSKFFAILTDKILPDLIYARRHSRQLRIWSAGCCTGEEPFSIAILLHQLIPNIKKWDIHLLATDINRTFLEKAKVNVFKAWSFRNTSEEIKKKFFIKHKDGSHSLTPEIKNYVKFSYLNLVEDDYPNERNATQDMDLILCNNVLIYFSQKQIEKTVHQLTAALVENGILVVTPIESPYVKEKNLKPLIIDSYSFFKKDSVGFIRGIERLLDKPLLEKEPAYKNNLANFLEAAQTNLPPLDNSLTKGSSLISKDEPSHQPKNIDTITSITALANSGKVTDAKIKCEEAISRDKVNPHLYYLYATILQDIEDLNGAEKALKKVIFLDDSFVIAHFYLGTIARKKGESLEAHRHFRNTLHLLKKYPPEALLPGTDNLTASSLAEAILSLNNKGKNEYAR